MDNIRVTRIKKYLAVTSFDDPLWRRADEVQICTYWSGVAAPKAREFRARLLWSPNALYVRFEAEQHERLIVSETPDLTKKAHGLWERDVCEIFVAPDRSAANKYYEFEVAPTGEWMDVGIEVRPAKRLTDWDYMSGMEAAARVETNKVIETVKIPFKALGRIPERGDVWLGNLFRCVGSGVTRGYLAWQPTHTKQPAFHVPSAFGEFEFVD